MNAKIASLCFFFGTLAIVKGEFCYSDVVGACSPSGSELSNCNAKYGAAHEVMKDLHNYVNVHITRNWQYLLMSTYFNNYEKNRAGFSKLYKELSDKAWGDAIDLIKYIGKRGGQMDFDFRKENNLAVSVDTYEMHEMSSLAKALDIQKHLAEESHSIHAEAMRRKHDFHDPEVGSFIENNFLHQHADTIRTLAGHTSDLKKLMGNTNDQSLALYFFDQYLQKTSL